MDEMCKKCWNDSCRNSGELYRSNKLLFCKGKLDSEDVQGYEYEEDEEGECYD